jgi:hypothetical protein
VTVRRAALDDSELLDATAELEPSASALSGALPKLQLDSREVGSTGFGDEPAVVPKVVGAVVFDGPASASGRVDWAGIDAEPLS